MGGEVNTSEPVQASNVIADIIPPQIERFTLDLNLGQLQLTFSETILTNSISASGATIHSSSDLSGSVYTRRLTGGTPVSGNGVQIIFQLSNVDLNALKGEDLFATSLSDTFLTLASSFASDAFGNRVVATTLMAQMVIPDDSPPTLDAFTLDLDSASLVLTFSEIIQSNTLMLDRFTIQSSAISAAISQTLSNSQRDTMIDSSIITVNILPADLYAFFLVPNSPTL